MVYPQLSWETQEPGLRGAGQLEYSGLLRALG